MTSQLVSLEAAIEHVLTSDDATWRPALWSVQEVEHSRWLEHAHGLYSAVDAVLAQLLT